MNNNKSIFSALLISFDYSIYFGVIAGITLAVPYMIMANIIGVN